MQWIQKLLGRILLAELPILHRSRRRRSGYMILCGLRNQSKKVVKINKLRYFIYLSFFTKHMKNIHHTIFCFLKLFSFSKRNF